MTYATLTLHVTEDGYLLGASEADHADMYSYWHPAGNADCSPCRSERWLVPTDMVGKLLAHGTDEQEYRDGYEAFDDVRAHCPCHTSRFGTK